MDDIRRKSPHELAVYEMDRAFGMGVEQARRLLYINGGAKRIYDCAVALIAEAIAAGRYDVPPSVALDMREHGADDQAMWDSRYRLLNPSAPIPRPHQDDRKGWEDYTGFSEDDFS